jgi:DNA-directed RNA polymerase III subunit RPC8
MYIDQNEIVRIRVETDEFYDDEPGPPKAAEGVQVRRELRRAPFSVIVSVHTVLCRPRDSICGVVFDG